MPIFITYFTHGLTTDNEKKIASGWANAPLSKTGEAQSAELKQKIKDKKFEVVFCSDIKQAAETAKLCFSDHAAVIEDKRLRECNYGKFSGQSEEVVEPMQMQYIKERFPEGECYEDVKDRIIDFLKFIKENHDGANIAIVSHQAPQLALEVLVKGKTWEKAFADDWRKQKAWQPGWDYFLE
jgi:broad specificity phosphatase PhoE